MPQAEISNIHSRINVPVVDGPAMGTRPFPILQGQGLVDVAANRTRLAAGLKSTNLEDILTVPVSLVPQHQKEPAPARVLNRLSQTVVLDHALHAQRLKDIRPHLVVVTETMGQFVQEIITLVPDVLMQLSQTPASLLLSFAAFPFLAETVLDGFQPSQRLPQELGMGDLLSSGERGEILQAQVDAHCCRPGDRWLCLRLLCGFDKDGHEILARCRPTDGGGLDLAIEPAVVDRLDAGYFEQVEQSIVEVHPDLLRTLERLSSPLLFELWKVGTFLEEVGEGVVEVAEGHLEGLGVDLSEPFVLLFQLREFVHERDAGEGLLVLFVGFGFSFEPPVVDKTVAAEVLCKKHLLLLRRIQSVAERLEHELQIRRRLL